MSVTLDGIDITGLVRQDEHAATNVESRVDLALDGNPIVWEQESGGMEMDLAGTADTGWLQKSILDEMKVRASVPGATYELLYEGTSFTVRFRNEDKPVISAEPLVPRSNQESTDYYKNVLIKLMEV